MAASPKVNNKFQARAFKRSRRCNRDLQITGYEIQQCIGQGGMAGAYLAAQTSQDRKVVLRVLDISIADSTHAVERFLNEARIVASLQHPHIITIFDIGTAGNEFYISMESVDGGDLKQRLARQISAPYEAVGLVKKTSASLAVVHAKGIVHRAVKPGDIPFRADGTPLFK